MAPKLLTFEDVMNSEQGETSASEPTDVVKFVRHFKGILSLEFKDQQKEGSDYLENLYRTVVFYGKSFRQKVPVSSSKEKVDDDEDDEEQTEEEKELKKDLVIQEADFLAIKLRTHYLCAVVRGSETKAVRSKIAETAKKDDGTTVTVAVVSYKLLQAVVSILLAYSDRKTKVELAPLGANVIRACKNKTVEKECWGIHAHAGLNFVARYVHQVTKDEAEKKVAKSKVKNAFPSVIDCILIAYRMDEQRHAKEKAKNPKTANLEHTTVKSIIQSTQLTTTEQDKAKEHIRKNMKLWGASFAGAADVTTRLLVAEMRKADRKGDKKDNERKPGGDEEEEEEEEEDGGFLNGI